MKKVLGVFLGLIAVIVIGAIGVAIVSEDQTNPLNGAASEAKAAAANAAIDASGVKDRVKSALESHRDAITAATGLSASEVDAAIDGLAIDDWTAIALPADAVKTGSIDGGSLGVDGTITLYEDPGYVTVNAYGQNVTLEVPGSAQSYLSYLGLLG